MLGVNYPKEHSINHKVINAFDIPSYKMTPHFDEVFRFISDSLKNGNILVHCAAGISRVIFYSFSQQHLFLFI
jgi:protein-tyrosine phosphatase